MNFCDTMSDMEYEDYQFIDATGRISSSNRVPKHATSTGWGNELQWLDEDGHWQHHPPRTKYSHPYSYDAFDLFKHEKTIVNGEHVKGIHAVYHDRMQQWDHNKFDAALEFTNNGNPIGELGFSWSNPEKVNQLMRHYFDDQTIRVVRVVEMCNVSSGYPVWLIYYRKVEK